MLRYLAAFGPATPGGRAVRGRGCRACARCSNASARGCARSATSEDASCSTSRARRSPIRTPRHPSASCPSTTTCCSATTTAAASPRPSLKGWTEVGWGSVLVDGFGAARWRAELDGDRATLWVEPFSKIARSDRAEISEEGERLVGVPRAGRGPARRAVPNLPRVRPRRDESASACGSAGRGSACVTAWRRAARPSRRPRGRSSGCTRAIPRRSTSRRGRGSTASEPADLEDALYGRRSLVRMLGMRRTLFVVPVELAPVMHEACTKALIPGQRARLVRMLEEQRVAPRGPRGGVAREGRRPDARRGRRSRRGHRARADRRRPASSARSSRSARARPGPARWACRPGCCSCSRRRASIVRTRPLGTWTSGQYRWATTEHWLGAPLRRDRPRRSVLGAPRSLAALRSGRRR